jgi:ABC-type antimicrobial peptide transport system permease subunit
MSLILASTLFISLFYQAILAKENQQIRKTTSFYNSDYLLTTYDDLDARLGIKPEVFSKIEKIKGIKEIETQSALPVKVIDSGVDRNEQFLKEKDEIVLRNYGFSLTGKLQGEAVYHTKLKGYNSNALKKLKKYLKAGNFDPENLSENEVILAMPTTSTSGPSKGSVGYFKNGEQLMSYQLGQTLTVSYASNFETKSEDYWKMTDNQTDYSQKKMKILAIAYYPYMQEVSLIEQGYPLIIMSDQAYQKIVPRYTYETINVNANAELSNIQKESIEEQLIRLAVINQQVTARSLIAEKEQLYSIYRKEIVYVFGIALVVLLLVIINLINSLKYRIETRKRELYLFKALGLSFKGLEKMIAFETTLFVFVSIAISTAVSIIITKLQYNYSQIYLLGLRFDYPVLPVVGLNFCIFGLCYLISVNLARGLRSSNIIEEFNKLE